MSFYDDPASPAAPLGDGSVFDVGDMVAYSPTTDERYVDTQSGFLVVVRRLQNRLALSVKRHVGTPPSTSIPLTPDESVKLSKILATSISGQVEEEQPQGGQRSKFRASRLERLHPESHEEIDDDQPTLTGKFNQYSQPTNLVSLLKKNLVATGVGCLVLIGTGSAIGFAVGGLFASPKTVAAAPTPVPVDPLANEKVDKFVRAFVANMLDFAPATYRASQVQAMAVMSNELLERYWKETNFPLSASQLGRLPQGMTIMIADLSQERLDAGTTEVKVHAQLNDAKNPKITTPVNLRLKLGVNPDGQLIVLEQADLTAAQ